MKMFEKLNKLRNQKKETESETEEEELSLLNHSTNTFSSSTTNQTKHKSNSIRSSTKKLIIGLIISSIILIIIILLFSIPDQIKKNLNFYHQNQSTDYQIDWKTSSPRPPSTFKNIFGLKSPKIGSIEWKDLYPTSKPSGPIPQPQWISRYNYLLKHPSNPLSYTQTVPKATLSKTNGLAIYPNETKLGSDGICSYRRKSCLRGFNEDFGMGLEDLWDGKLGTWSINFDDGPLPPSQTLYNFLDLQNQSATHFWIGSNVRDHYELALQAYKRHDHLAVHTWTHAHLTTLDDLGIIGELGWTIQIIFDLTGLIPLYYRPPYGDVDNRVRAIAKHVFGLKTLMWNSDSSDWSLNQTYALGDYIDPPMQNFGINQSLNQIQHHLKDNPNENPIQERKGMIILEHELSEESVRVFELSFKDVVHEGFITCNVADCLNQKWYQ